MLSQCHVQQEVPADAVNPCMVTTNGTNGGHKKPVSGDPDRDDIGGTNEFSS
jgi:hypothetical protein